jgi:hypothetical protein
MAAEQQKLSLVIEPRRTKIADGNDDPEIRSKHAQLRRKQLEDPSFA